MQVACAGLSRWFERRATLVTPSRLVAAVAAQEFARTELSCGLESWERAAIQSIDAWLAGVWQEARYSGTDVPSLLSPYQERVLWRRIIEGEQSKLFDVSAATRLAVRSARLLAEWQIPSAGDIWGENQDTGQFQHWYQRFRRICQTEGWITRADLLKLVPKWIANGRCQPGQTVFAAFAICTPALQNIKLSLGQNAITEPFSLSEPSHAVPIRICGDFSEEIEQAARWARATFEQQSSHSVGVFVPELSTYRSLVGRIFRYVMYPSSAVWRSANTSDSIFHITSPAPVRDHPLVAGALLLLEVARPRIPSADASAILRCPFITGAAAERNSRALADIRLRKLREVDVSLRQIEWVAQDCPLLAKLWPQVGRVLRRKSARMELAGWSAFLGDLLEALGWPGDVALNSHQQDVVEAWKNALSTLASLGLILGQVGYDEALEHLRGLLSGAGTEIGDWLSPIQILDASDAPGIRFDRAILTGLSDERWPPSINVSPLVPFKLQQSAQVPGSSPQSVQRERQRSTQCLFTTGSVLCATHSGRLSPVAAPFVTNNSNGFPVWGGRLPQDCYRLVALDEIEDRQAPAYRPGTDSRGGTSIIRAQSSCPFRAFAEIRLRAELPEDACFGFDARERGSFVHKALQYVWQQLETQAQLRSTSNDRLRSIVRQAVEVAVKSDERNLLRGQLSCIERERLEELILAWLALERQRERPFAVELLEQERYHELAGLRLRLRIDRVDRLNNGKLVLIDYKSGKQSRPKLVGARPAEPQLLVYASSIGQDVDGIFFGEVKPREVRAVGFSREKHFSGNAAEVKSDWASFLRDSFVNIEKIAQGFVAGFAAVDPIKGACDHCSVEPFCRIRDRSVWDEDDTND